MLNKHKPEEKVERNHYSMAIIRQLKQILKKKKEEEENLDPR